MYKTKVSELLRQEKSRFAPHASQITAGATEVLLHRPTENKD